jgi:hypothetical protein
MTEWCVYLLTELLPSTPQHVKVEALSEHTLQVSWQFPAENAHSVSQYEINVTHVTSLNPPDDVINFTTETPENVTVETQAPFKLQVKVRQLNGLLTFKIFIQK